MNKPMLKRARKDILARPQALNNGNVTGHYYGMQDYRKAVVYLNVGAMAAGTNASVQLRQAKDASGADAKNIDDAVATIVANTNVKVATVTADAVVNDNTVTINGVAFKGAAEASIANRLFLANDGDDNATAASLVAVVNGADIGVVASANDAVVTLAAGEETLTVAGTADRLVVATVAAEAGVEVGEVNLLDTAEGFEYITAVVTTTADTVVSADIHRGDPRFEPEHRFNHTIL